MTSRLIDGLSKFLAILAALIAASIMFAMTIDVVVRYTRGGGISGVYGYSVIALVGVAYLGMADAQRRGEHVSATFLVSRLPNGLRRMVRLVVLVLVAVFLVALLAFTTEEALHSYLIGEERFGLVRVPVWPARWMIAIGLFCFLLQIIRSFRERRAESETPDSVVSSPHEEE